MKFCFIVYRDSYMWTIALTRLIHTQNKIVTFFSQDDLMLPNYFSMPLIFLFHRWQCKLLELSFVWKL